MSEQEQILKSLQKAYADMINESVDLKLLCDKLKNDNKELLNIIIRWEKENETLQESLDGAQREIEKLNDNIQRTMGGYVEGEGG